jgi:hypothetical protein
MRRDDFHEIERARSALWSLDAGTDRDTWVKNGMAAKAAGLDFGDFHDWSEQARELRQREPNAAQSGRASKDGFRYSCLAVRRRARCRLD